jgi:putative effector of murein hydrolase LrgA (UPF0299 family)
VLLVFGLILHQSAFANFAETISNFLHISMVVAGVAGLLAGVLFGLVRLKRHWLVPAVGCAALILVLVLALIVVVGTTPTQSGQASIAIFLCIVSFLLGFTVVSVLMQDVRGIFYSKGVRKQPLWKSPWKIFAAVVIACFLHAVWKSPWKIFAVVVIACFLHAVVDGVPSHYCRSEKKRYTEKEVCSLFLDYQIKGGFLLLGPGEMNGADYYKNHPKSCGMGYGRLNTPEQPIYSWRLGGLYEFLFVDEVIGMGIQFDPTPLGMTTWGIEEFGSVRKYYEMNSCLALWPCQVKPTMMEEWNEFISPVKSQIPDRDCR